MVSKGEFKSELYYRLNAFHIHLPPLREQPQDIPVLTDFFIQHFSKLHGRNITDVNTRVRQYLEMYDWPGGNLSEIARLSGLSRITCHRLIKKLNLEERRREG